MLFRSSVRNFTAHNAKVVRVSGMDHDGCFGMPYITPAQSILAHQPVLDQLKQQAIARPLAFDYVTSTSNRQSIDIDCNNAILNQNNLAFPVTTTLAKSLGAHFDPLLLADITAHRLPGYTLSQLKSAIAHLSINPYNECLSDSHLATLSKIPQAGYCFSLDKINILYAQMHRMATLHPNYHIEFNVYDDLLEQVLLPLGSFYQKYPSLIPANLTLTLHHYDTTCNVEYSHHHQALPTITTQIRGHGNIDSHYYSTVNAMTHVAIKEEGSKSSYQLSAYLTPESILLNTAHSLR